MNFGIEGRHYIKKSDTIIDFPEGIDAKSSNYYPGHPYFYANQFLNYTFSNENPGKWEAFKAWNEAAKKSRIIGFTFEPTPVSSEIAAVNNINVPYLAAAKAGAIDVEKDLPKIREAVKAAGGDKIIAEKQKQIDAWVAASKKK